MFDTKIILNAAIGAAAAILLISFVKSKMADSEKLENADDDDDFL